ncbi:hypothetical protein EON68_01405 [archaeon]|nr:MAG: hypothetical protein EON68_01405 [archaeon]
MESLAACELALEGQSPITLGALLPPQEACVAHIASPPASAPADTSKGTDGSSSAVRAVPAAGSASATPMTGGAGGLPTSVSAASLSTAKVNVSRLSAFSDTDFGQARTSTTPQGSAADADVPPLTAGDRPDIRRVSARAHAILLPLSAPPLLLGVDDCNAPLLSGLCAVYHAITNLSAAGGSGTDSARVTPAFSFVSSHDAPPLNSASDTAISLSGALAAGNLVRVALQGARGLTVHLSARMPTVTPAAFVRHLAHRLTAFRKVFADPGRSLAVYAGLSVALQALRTHQSLVDAAQAQLKRRSGHAPHRSGTLSTQPRSALLPRRQHGAMAVGGVLRAPRSCAFARTQPTRSACAGCGRG